VFVVVILLIYTYLTGRNLKIIIHETSFDIIVLQLTFLLRSSTVRPNRN
jgi:hypothetical protein